MNVRVKDITIVLSFGKSVANEASKTMVMVLENNDRYRVRLDVKVNSQLFLFI